MKLSKNCVKTFLSLLVFSTSVSNFSLPAIAGSFQKINPKPNSTICVTSDYSSPLFMYYGCNPHNQKEYDLWCKGAWENKMATGSLSKLQPFVVFYKNLATGKIHALPLASLGRYKVWGHAQRRICVIDDGHNY
jgi:hypothetical protein